MSFGNFARRVRNPQLSYGHRVSALRSCVQLYRPLGFQATLRLLTDEAGSYRQDEAALVRAVEVLEASRAAWQAEVKEYARRRRAEKARGHRRPHPADTNPYHPTHWYPPPD